MRVLITGGAGFIGRWIVNEMLPDYSVNVIDNMSNGSLSNLNEFKGEKNFKGLIKGDIKDMYNVGTAFQTRPEIVIHAAAQVNVQESLDNPVSSYENNILGTFNILEACRKRNTRLILIGTCMVYDISDTPITEMHPVKPLSPYAASKLSAEYLAESYYHGYGLPVSILRPFNTYGPYQKSNLEGGVVSIFVKRAIEGKKLQIFGSGKQTRDLLWVGDTARFVAMAARNEESIGQVINAGTGKDITINKLAKLVSKGQVPIEHVEHHHPQSEIMKLQCDPSKAKKILNWEPKVSIEKGVNKLEDYFNGELNG
ncbi:MAG: GDP-mannose 4,6-dehydratase [Candidatus Peribacteraceae bacterium]|nr:GDP-mannose 4,6-dehydratase [Candidatus Peribacteraceae bacterium]